MCVCVCLTIRVQCSKEIHDSFYNFRKTRYRGMQIMKQLQRLASFQLPQFSLCDTL